nr:helix-turn-helix domain-containing protein [Pontixanthobacter rizhaonensis]
MTGYRLRPGTTVPETALRAIKECSADAAQILEVEQSDGGSIDAVIAALSDTAETICSVVKNSGVSARTLQRQFRKLGLPAPEYWRLLGRARRSAQFLAQTPCLSQIAADCGYSDQAHMTREFKRWFGKALAQLRQDQDAMDALGQPALGNWTGEQISIR